jgi:short-subunit dehydrogenase
MWATAPLIMDAETVAKIGYRGLMNNQTVVIPGLKNQLLAQSVRVTPRKMVTKIVRKMQEKEDKN